LFDYQFSYLSLSYAKLQVLKSYIAYNSNLVVKSYIAYNSIQIFKFGSKFKFVEFIMHQSS